MEQHKTTLRDLREQNGMTRAEVAKVLGVSISTIFKYEAGTRVISIQQVKILMDLYYASAEDVIDAQLNSCHSDR